MWAFLEQIAAQVAVRWTKPGPTARLQKLRTSWPMKKLYLEEEIRAELNFRRDCRRKPGVENELLSQARTVAPSDATVLIWEIREPGRS